MGQECLRMSQVFLTDFLACQPISPLVGVWKKDGGSISG